jgi:hypothetical protein
MASGSPDGLRQVVVSGVVENVPVVPLPANEVAAGAIGRYTGTAQTYQTIATWTVTTNKIGELKEILVLSSDWSKTQFQITIGDTVFKSSWQMLLSMPLLFVDLRLAEGTTTKVECKSTDGTSITVDAVITGKEIG